MTARRGLLVAALGIALLGGCSTDVRGTPGPTTAAPPAPAAPAPADTAAPEPTTTAPAPAAGTGADGCVVTITRGAVRITGSGRANAADGRYAFACRGGPEVTVSRFDARGVRFTVQGKHVLVAKGATRPVGPYRIATLEVDATNARFEVLPSG